MKIQTLGGGEEGIGGPSEHLDLPSRLTSQDWKDSWKQERIRRVGRNLGKVWGPQGEREGRQKERDGEKDKGHAGSSQNKGHHTLILRMEMAEEPPPPQDFPIYTEGTF